MRRKEREISSVEEKLQVVRECQICRIAFGGEVPYIVPVNYGIDVEGDQLVIYFHGALAGRKYDIVNDAREEGRILRCGFEMDQKNSLVEGNTACEHTYFFESIVGTGRVELVEENERKKNGLCCIMKQMTGKSFSFTDTMIKNVGVFQIIVEEYTGKRNS